MIVLQKWEILAQELAGARELSAISDQIYGDVILFKSISGMRSGKGGGGGGVGGEDANSE